MKNIINEKTKYLSKGREEKEKTNQKEINKKKQ